MLKVGLTGGYATGKSFVAARLEELGCRVIYADRLGHLALQPDGEAYSPTVEAFGTGILNPDRTINRQKLGQLVFSSPAQLQTLTEFVHPAVFRLEERLLAQFEAEDPSQIAVVEAAILIETGRFTVFDRLIVTFCEEAIQIARGMERDRITREQVLERIRQQLSSDAKKKFAHYAIDTGKSKEDTLRQVDDVYNDLRNLSASLNP